MSNIESVWVCGDGIEHTNVPDEKQADYVCRFGCGLKYGETGPVKTTAAKAPNKEQIMEKLAEDLSDAVNASQTGGAGGL